MESNVLVRRASTSDHDCPIVNCSFNLDVGNRRESRSDRSESYVVREVIFCFGRVDLNIVIRPGPPKTTSGASSTYFVPWKVKVVLI